ncbi:serine/threonine-protein kinase [Acinetobacter variabilis]|uniref:serine/threonine-protein kinase n=1 Tax=Acinetobacter variabilis TaxID=70346 RepID=UPI001330F3C2|nr:serine/threonine-protein kinase [Acinetobacter variabilis]
MSIYNILRRIGQGGFAEVSLIAFPDGSQAARKKFHPNQAQPLGPAEIEHIKERFKREVIILSSINHPNVVKVLASEIDIDPPAYIMPLANATLAQDLMTIRGYPIQDRIKVFMDILAGLEAIHDLSIYHRDLKPQNILRFGNDYAISDFGLISLDKSQVSVLTQTGMNMGSDRYTAPEITSELKFASRASDIYSAGCILHDLTTQGSGIRIPCHQIRDPGNPYEWILQICTRLDKNDRFQSVKELREAVVSTVLPGSNQQPTQGSPQETLLADLKAKDTYEISFLNTVLNFLENSNYIDSHSVFLNLEQVMIEKIIATNDSNIISRLSHVYSKWVSNSSFDFSMCDVLASRLDIFWNVNDPEVRSNVLLGLLIMGTRHNRWYVEQKFVSRVKSCDPLTAQRFVLESAVRKQQVSAAINHLPNSINFSRLELPTIIQQGFASYLI